MMTKEFLYSRFVVFYSAFSSCKIGKQYARPELNLPDRIENLYGCSRYGVRGEYPWESLYADGDNEDLIKRLWIIAKGYRDRRRQ